MASHGRSVEVTAEEADSCDSSAVAIIDAPVLPSLLTYVGGGQPLRRLAKFVARRPWGTSVVACAVLLRVVVWLAYRPAFMFVGDSYGYLSVARHLQLSVWHPIGYSVLLRALFWAGSLWSVTLLQHLLGLAAGILVYGLVRRMGVGDLGAALAAAPVLLDAWQVSVEQGVVTEALFGVLIIVALRLVVAHRVSVPLGLVVGALLAAAALTRTIGLFVGIVVVGFLAFRRPGWKVVGAAIGALGVPVVGYAFAFQAAYGAFELQSHGGVDIYGETATFADCSKLPPASRAICPANPVNQRAGSNWYVWSSSSPIAVVRGGSMPRDRAGNAFARAVIRRQPLGFARYVGDNLAHYFDVGRASGPGDFYAQTWQFPVDADPNPSFSMRMAHSGFDGSLRPPTVSTGLAGLLRRYQQVGFTPGPCLALALVLAIGGAVFGRSRHRAEIALFTVTGAALLVVTTATAGFDYRYLLPVLLVWPPAGVLGAQALRRRLWPDAALRPAVLRLGAGALVAGFVATNLLATNVTPIRLLRPPHVLAMGATARLPNGLLVRLADPTIVAASCVSPPEGKTPATIAWRVEAGLVARVSGGTSTVVGARNLGIEKGSWWTYGHALPRALWLRDELVSPAHRTARGLVSISMIAPAMDLVYTDPVSGGTAAWRLEPKPAPGTPTPGVPCSPRR